MANLFSVATMTIFLLFQISSVKTDVVENNNCSKGFAYFSKIKALYKKGVVMYAARKVKITSDSLGNPVYKIRKRNKEISYLNGLTKIICTENKSGTYFLTIEILQKWENWFLENCDK